MNQIYRKSPFWSLAGPMLGYLAIQFVVQFAAQLVIEMPYVMRAYAEILRGSSDTVPSMQELLNSYMQTLEPAFEAIVRYQVEIAALSALGTIVLTGILFARDRKLKAIAFHEKENPPLTLAFSLFQDRSRFLVYRIEKGFIDYLHIDKRDFSEEVLRRCTIDEGRTADDGQLLLPLRARRKPATSRGR